LAVLLAFRKGPPLGGSLRGLWDPLTAASGSQLGPGRKARAGLLGVFIASARRAHSAPDLRRDLWSCSSVIVQGGRSVRGAAVRRAGGDVPQSDADEEPENT
jgi:hypothetical protein